MPMTRRDAIWRQGMAALALLGPLHGRANDKADAAAAAGRTPLPLRVAAPRPDSAELLPPSAVQIQGWLGERIAINAKRHLIDVDTVPLLAGYQHKPGNHPWIGEHVGKWLHAATLAWAHTGDAALRAKLDEVAAALIAAQERDGYLGTYAPGKRLGLFEGADWDVWSHKYCLVGLLTYYQYTAHAPALKASRKAADLLIATFPAKRSLVAAGTHEGMAATSLLEPVVLLYRITGDARYLRFARYVVQAMEKPDGPGIVAPLLQGTPVSKVSNAKAYEMLANLVGLCELSRATGERRWSQASLNAWQDIVDKRLYVTGTTSQYERFQPDHDMRDGLENHVGEVCVTVTWIQLNMALLQITGEARFGNELERTFYNHLTAAQHPNGESWTDYTALAGRKKYDKGISCCHSSGPRGVALAPQAAYLHAHAKDHDVLLVSTFETSTATFALGGQAVTVEQRSGFPYTGEAVLTLHMARPARFALKVRAPDWAQPLRIEGATLEAGWAGLAPRTWRDGDQVSLRFRLASNLMTGATSPDAAPGSRGALTWGPFVLACERQPDAGSPPPRSLGLGRGATAKPLAPGARLRFEADVETAPAAARMHTATFVTFADAGAERAYQVWLRAPGAAPPALSASQSLLVNGEESRSRSGNVRGSVIDDDLGNLVNTWDGQFATEDWFAVTLDEPAVASRFVFTHGRNYFDGGWFDTQGGKPRVQVQRTGDGPWESVGVLEDYPATTASRADSLAPAAAPHRFSLNLPAPVRFVAVRVIGKPSSGVRPQQAFVTCAELQAFAR